MSGDWRQKSPFNLTVLSADPGRSACVDCGQIRIIYQGHLFKQNLIRARCKDCLIRLAGGAEKVVVRQVPEVRGLRELWGTEQRDAGRASRLPFPRRKHGATGNKTHFGGSS